MRRAKSIASRLVGLKFDEWMGLLKLLALLFAAVGGLVGVSVHDHADAKATAKEAVWTEAGDHFQDLVKTNEERWNDIVELRSENAEMRAAISNLVARPGS